MDFRLGRINLNAVAQGVGGLVFGNDNGSSATEDSQVERLLDRISNGVLAEDRRAAVTELQLLVTESRSAQLAIGAMGFPVLLSVLKEEKDDVEIIRGALETLVSALTPIDTLNGQKNEIQPVSINSDLLSQEKDSISLLLSLLSEDDFYVRYYTLQLLTALLTHSPNRLQEAILSIPRGITSLVDMLMDREVIRNEALLLLTYLTREAKEIQKILVFEGAFEKIFSIIKEEGGSDGGVVVQDCLELLNNLVRNNSSNQVLLKETIGFEPLVSILKLRRGSAYNFTQQKTINLLNSMETVNLLLIGGQDSELVNDSNRSSNQTALAQNKLLDHLLMLGVESQWASVSVRCSALRCIGNLVRRNPQNLDALASRLVGEERHAEPALNSILRIILRTSVVEEFIAADYVFRCFCEKNPDGQMTLASTMTPQPNSNTDDDGSLSFGSMLLQTLVTAEGTEGLEACCRAASVLSHILKDSNQCKGRVLKIVLDAPVPSLSAPEPLLHRMVKHLACATPRKNKNNEETTGSSEVSYIQPVILHLLITWLADCPNAVNCILDSPAHLTYLIELISNENSSVSVRGFAAFVLGECVLHNKSSESNRDAFSVVDAISQKIGLTAYFINFDELKKLFLSLSLSHSAQERKPMMRSSSASMIDMEEVEMDDNATDQKHEHPILLSIFDPSFLNFIRKLEVDIRERIMEVYSQTKNKVATVPAELEQKDGENVSDYVKRLKSFVVKQCHEIQDLVARNSTLADELVHTGSNSSSDTTDRSSNTRERIESESLRKNLQEATRHIEILNAEKLKIETEANDYKNLAGKLESDLKSLSDAYNSLEQENIRLESEVKILGKGGNIPYLNVEEINEKAREEAQKESEAELNDLLVCLGQEQSKVEKLSSRLEELGEDVDSLLEGIGDDAALVDEDEEDGEEN